MLRDENFLEAEQRLPQAFGGVLLVMQMHLDLAEPRPTQARQRVEIFLLVFLDRKKKRVARRPTVAVAEVPELFRILLDPGGDPPASSLKVRLARLGFKVIGDAKNDVNFFVESRRLKTVSLCQIGRQPVVHVPTPDLPRN